jgi:oxygen-independent coproporphyrinogen-3 oxidase
MRPADLNALLQTAASHFRLSTSVERDFSIELDPRQVQAGDIAEYARIGFNRASLGVQDFDPQVQRAVNRIQSVAETCASSTLPRCRLPLGECRPDLRPAQANDRRILSHARYGAREPTRSRGRLQLRASPAMFKAQRQIDDADLPSNEAKLGLLALAVEQLSERGYRYIGMDHFALPTTISPSRKCTARCSGTSWATPRTRIATWSGSA